MAPRFSLVVAALAFLAIGCADAPDSNAPGDTLATPMPDLDTTTTPTGVDGDLGTESAVAILRPTEGNDVRGRVTFTNVADGVQVVAEIDGLSEGAHGFHVHENGDCSAPDASSAGGHFNPTDAPHGAPDDPAAERHVGDLGNLDADADGTADYDRVDAVITLSGPNAIVGKAVIVHAGQDDYTSQPSGEAGNRLACGIIQATDGVDVDE